MSRSPRVSADVAWLGACVTIAAAPFEAVRPIADLSLGTLTSAELVVGAALALWLAVALWTGPRPEWRTPLTWPWLMFIAAMLLAAFTAPEYRANALNMVGRFAAAFLVFLMVVHGTAESSRLWGVVAVGVVAGVALAMLIVLEFGGIRVVRELLEPFHTGVAMVGPYRRASGPFSYPTIASMYLEVLFALGTAVLLRAANGRRLRTVAMTSLALVIIGAGVVSTLTRAGMLVLATTLVITMGIRWRHHRIDLGIGALSAVGIALVVVGSAALPDELIRLRATTEDISGWFHARIDAPEHLSLRPGEAVDVSVLLTNVGLSPWDASVRLSYHWLPADDDRVVSWAVRRTALPESVTPASSVPVVAHVIAPGEPGEYRLWWDLQQGERVWFSTEPKASRTFTRVTISGPTAGPGAPLMTRPMPRPAVRPGRSELWQAALHMTMERPLTGVGPDNFRQLYGPYIGLDNFDPRLHANNMYLEILVGGGVFAAAAFTWLLVAIARTALPPLQMSAPLGVGLSAALIAIAAHGAVDSFLGFTPTYVLFASVLALVVNAARAGDSGAPHTRA